MLNNVLLWIRADWTHALVAIGAVLFAIATVWGAIKAAYLKTVGHPMPRTRLTLTLDVIAELALNALGAINKVLSARGAAALFPPTAPPPPADSGAPLVGRPGSPGRTDVGTLVSVLAVAVLTLAGVAVLGALTQGCGPGRELVMRVAPGVPSPSSCSPAGASRCEGAVPVVCSSSGRWWPATPASAPCAHGCVADDAGAYCAAADGGVR